jgi:A/G-specific adenine glycosylase
VLTETKVVGQSSSSAPNVVDIEDVCTLCDPLTNEATVTSYPMKVERKNIREELDVVNVVEWRHTTSGNRQFLLVRRPEGGERIFPNTNEARSLIDR